jgi:outer membrane autotransporter protein
VLVGIDRWLNDAILGGFEFGYAHNYLSLHDNGGDGGIDNYRFGTYLAGCSNGWFFDTAATYGLHDSQLSRNVLVGALATSPQSNFNSNDVSIHAEGGRSLALGDYFLSPVASAQYTHLWQNSFRETGGGGANLNLDSAGLQSLRTRLLLQASRSFDRGANAVIPTVYAGWAHEFMGAPTLDASLSNGGTVFTTQSPVWYRNSAVFGGALMYQIGASLQVGLRYQAELFQSAAQIHYGEASAVYNF